MRIESIATLLAALLIGSLGQADNLKVAALFAVDSDRTVRESIGIGASGSIMWNILDGYCGPKYRSIAKPTVLHMDRTPTDGKVAITPRDLLVAIEAMQTTSNDIIFVYACCHGGYVGDDHYLFLATNEQDEVTGLKRADVVAALKKKPSHAIVFLTDSCSTTFPRPPAMRLSLFETPEEQKGHFYRILASLPKGTFLDINTSRKGQFAAIKYQGAIGTEQFVNAMADTWKNKTPTWDAVQTAWQSNLTQRFKQVRDEVLKDQTISDALKNKYEAQNDQELDVKNLGTTPRSEAVKVAALFAIDSDRTALRDAASLGTTGYHARRVLDLFCEQKYRTIGEPTLLQMDRTPQDSSKTPTTPRDFLAAIEAMNTTKYDVIFVYACCYGGYSGDDHYLFLAKGQDGVTTGLKRADVVAALKKKPYYAVVFLTDSCSNPIPRPRAVTGPGVYQVPDSARDHFHKILTSLGRGTFVDINTSRNGQFSAINHQGGIGTRAFEQAVGETWQDKTPTWDALQNAWQKNLTRGFQVLRDKVAKDPSYPDDLKKKFADQLDQELDVKPIPKG